ncbi:MAG: hypothetical protein ACTSO7_03285 [Candidatus Heimdallarchaeota archaeon]
MGKKQILLMINSVLIIALFCNLSLVSASDLSWNAGDIINWGYYREVTTTATNIAADTTLENVETDGYDFNFNITAYDSLSKDYEYILSDPGGTYGVDSQTFDWEDMADAFLTPDDGDFINVNYQWNDAINSTLLTGFTLDLNKNNFLDHWRLIEPNWAEINTRFKSIFNRTHLLQQVTNPYTAVIGNYTWGVLLDHIDFKIMGRKNLDYALNQFKPAKTKWKFEFDLSGYLFFNTPDGYKTYESYIVTLEMEYSDGGVLEKFVKDISYIAIYDGVQTERLTHLKEAIGGLKKAMMPVPLISAIIGLLTISTFVLIKKRKKK